jgi:hypothetical protein
VFLYFYLLLFLLQIVSLLLLLFLFGKSTILRKELAGLHKLIHFLSAQLRLGVFNAVQSVLQDLDVFLLVSDKTTIGGVSHADMEVKTACLVQVAIGEFRDGDELVVAPALADIELGGVFSDSGFLEVQVIEQLDFILVFVFVFVALGELQKH